MFVTCTSVTCMCINVCQYIKYARVCVSMTVYLFDSSCTNFCNGSVTSWSMRVCQYDNVRVYVWVWLCIRPWALLKSSCTNVCGTCVTSMCMCVYQCNSMRVHERVLQCIRKWLFSEKQLHQPSVNVHTCILVWVYGAVCVSVTVSQAWSNMCTCNTSVYNIYVHESMPVWMYEAMCEYYSVWGIGQDVRM